MLTKKLPAKLPVSDYFALGTCWFWINALDFNTTCVHDFFYQ